jgi:ABC-2 type transport system ATP-binding protein
MIEVREVTKRYGSTVAVDGLSFEVRAGEVTGFLGPNGAGKSTTMRMMVGLDAPTSGRVTIDGHRYPDLRFPLHHVGALLEAKAIHPGRSARNHLLWLADSNGIDRRRVDHVLELVGLDDVAHRRFGGFSLGMGQRLGIATALLGDPATLLLDEPVNGLDPEGIQWVRQLLRSLAAEGRSILVSSHLMSEMPSPPTGSSWSARAGSSRRAPSRMSSGAAQPVMCEWPPPTPGPSSYFCTTVAPTSRPAPTTP